MARARILVVGDVMLDRYWFGETDRISPEAPVPVVKINRVDERAGGAANVARNIASLGGHAHLLAVVGQDEAAVQLAALLQRDNVKSSLYHDPDIATTVKLRVVAQQQQLIRIDFENKPTHEILANKLNEYQQLLTDIDVVILSDYGKGGLDHIQTMIKAANALNKPVLVDPKGHDYSRYLGATVLTPNKSEFKQVAGAWTTEEAFVAKAKALRQALALTALMVTRSEDGLSLFTQDEEIHRPTVAREVYDVSGAGDTVIATMGLMLAAGLPFREAMEWSNRAAGIVVGKLGTATVTVDDLFAQGTISHNKSDHDESRQPSPDEAL
jgi:rfaE bifunctional protein kinase chain/domain